MINIVSKQSIADECNNFFVSVGSNLAKKITVADNAASIYDYIIIIIIILGIYYMLFLQSPRST